VPKVYDSWNEAVDAALEQIGTQSDLPTAEFRKFLGKDTVAQEQGPSPISPTAQPVLVGRYVLRNDELVNVGNFLGLVKSTTKFVVGVVGIHTLAGAAAIADALYGLYTLFTGIKAKGFTLSNQQFAVVSTLRRDSATSDQLVERMKETTAEKIEEILEPLTKTDARPNGVVVKDNKEVWSLHNV
jgi:hypothetical protein